MMIGGLLVALAIYSAIRTAVYRADSPTVAPAAHLPVPPDAAGRLAGSLRFQTISREDTTSIDHTAFQSLHEYLQTAFPRAHAQLQRELVAEHSVLYTWRGSNPALPGILLMGHLDVVPVEPGTEQRWQHGPFNGVIADGFIWGRGAIDNKSQVVGTLEAVEWLISENFQPARTIYLAFGHDEEVGGTRGARRIAELLRQRGVQLELVLDEGGVIGEGLMPGVTVPTALIGIAEKGFVSIELSTRSAGGHSSLPPRQSAIGIISSALARLEANQMPARFEAPTQQLFQQIGPHLPMAQRAVFANLWITRPVVLRKLAANPSTNAMIRTTTAPTIFQAGTKENLLPSHARAVVNFRILTGDSIRTVLQHVQRVVADPRIEIKAAQSFTAEPSAVSSTRSDSYRTLQQSIQSIVPEAIVAPYLVVVVTDARYYHDLSANVFRLLPLNLNQSDLERMHGTNERVSIQNYERAIRFYRQLIMNAAGG